MTTFEVRDIRAKERFVIDDVYLNGYAKLCGIYATGVYVSLCRHADKQQKSFPSLLKIAEELAISSRQVARAMDILISHNIIKKERIGKKANNRYWLVDKSEWTTSPISELPVSPVTIDYQSSHHMTTSPVHSKETHKKETHSKELATVSRDIVAIFDIFKEINPGIKYGNTTQREASDWLVQKYGIEKALGLAKAAVAIHGKRYAPVITTPYLLKDKLGELSGFYKRQKDTTSSKTGFID